jgi:phosphoribosylanthranilate isomerase
MRGIVKICGLSTAPSVESALAAGADMVGFVFFAKSPRHVSLEQARALGELARGQAKLAALTVDADDAALAKIVEALTPDFLQLHGRETPDRVMAIRKIFGVATIKAIGIEGPNDLTQAGAYADAADMLLYDAKAPKDARLPGGNGVPFDWRLLDGVAREPAYLLSGGLDADNVAEAIRLSGAYGVDVSSGVESAPGIKDNAKIAAFVARARTTFAETAEKRSERNKIAGRVA